MSWVASVVIFIWAARPDTKIMAVKDKLHSIYYEVKLSCAKLIKMRSWSFPLRSTSVEIISGHFIKLAACFELN